VHELLVLERAIAVDAALILRPTEFVGLLSGGGISDVGFFVEYADYVFPLALTLGGLAIMAVAIARTKPGKPN
jgi:hypothetical protein